MAAASCASREFRSKTDNLWATPYRQINIFWNDTQVYTNTGSFTNTEISLNLTFVANKKNVLRFTSANGYNDTSTTITPPSLTIYAVPNV